MGRQKVQGGSSNADRNGVAADPRPPSSDSEPEDEAEVEVVETIPRKRRRGAEEAKAEDGEDDDDDDDDSIGRAPNDPTVMMLKAFHRFEPPRLNYSSGIRTLSAGYGLATAIDTCLWLPHGGRNGGGGALCDKLGALIQAAYTNAASKSLLLQNMVNEVTKILAPLYILKRITIPSFSLLESQALLPIMAVHVKSKKGMGFAVASNWILDIRDGKQYALPFNVDSLKAVGYLQLRTLEDSNVEVNEQGAHDKSASAEDDNPDDIPNPVKSSSYEVDPDYTHYAFTMNQDFIKVHVKEKNDKHEQDRKPAALPPGPGPTGGSGGGGYSQSNRRGGSHGTNWGQNH